MRPSVKRVRVTCGRGSVLLWQHCNTLFTSGFVDEVVFADNNQEKATPAARRCIVQFLTDQSARYELVLRLHLLARRWLAGGQCGCE